MSQFVSDEYRSVLRRTHAAQRGRWGRYGSSHLSEISEYARELGAESVLDYGCGTGTLARAASFDVREYDPGIAGKDNDPEPADLVVATDVLEHVEPDRLRLVLRHIHSLCRLGAFFVVATKPARLTLVDGRNAHLIVRSGAWWLSEIRYVGFQVVRSEKRKGLFVWARRQP